MTDLLKLQADIAYKEGMGMGVKIATSVILSRVKILNFDATEANEILLAIERVHKQTLESVAKGIFNE